MPPFLNKVCPVLVRRKGGAVEVLAFEHPLAGLQLVKGSIEPGESVEAAALRELAEESGIGEARVLGSLGVWSSGHQGQVWSFVECEAERGLPETWCHDAPDDGGHRFRFFWHALHEDCSAAQWPPVFRDALRFIQAAL